MIKDNIMKVIITLAATAASLVTAGVLPAWAAIIATAVGSLAGTMHTAPGMKK